MSRIGAICRTKSSHRSTAWRSRSLRRFLRFSAVLPMPLLFHRSATTSMASCSSGSSMSMASKLSTCLRMASAAGPVGSSPLSTVLTSGCVAAIWARVAGSIFFLSSFSCGYGCLRAGDGRQKYVFVAACCSEMLGRHNAASTGVPAAQAMRAMRAVRTSYAAMSAWQRCTRTPIVSAPASKFARLAVHKDTSKQRKKRRHAAIWVPFGSLLVQRDQWDTYRGPKTRF